MSLIINILITLIGLAIILIIFYNYIPQIEKILAERLKISLFRNTKDHGVLGQIFLRYNHRDAQSWVDWAISQEESVQDEAINLLIQHIDNVPSIWGAVTPEAIKALAQFQKREHLTIMKSVLKACKKFWKKYKISESCYEAALIGMVYINPESAKTFLNEEINELEEESQAMSVANTLNTFSEEDDINPLFIKVLTNSQISAKARNYTINLAQKRSEEQAHLAFIGTINAMLESSTPLSDDDIKIFEVLMNMVTSNVDEDAFTMLLKACTHTDLAKTSIKSMELILKSNFSEFNPQQLYALINIKTDEMGLLQNTIADINKLSPDEKQLCKYFNFETKFPFKKAPVATENKNTSIEVHPSLSKIYVNFMEMIKKKSIDKQNGHPGGILLSGYTDNEKLALTRAAAGERKWHFIYTAVEDAIASSSTAKTMADAINSHKPCILYLDDVGILMKHLDSPFFKQIKTIGNDPLVSIVGTLKDDADINENGLCVLFTHTPEMELMFPTALSVGRLDEASRKTLLNEKLAKLSNEINTKSFEESEFLKATEDMTPFEFDKYLAKYFRASILISKKLIPHKEFEQLDEVEFEGRGDL